MTPKSTKRKPRLHLVRGDLDRESLCELAHILEVTKRDLDSYFKHGRVRGRYKASQRVYGDHRHQGAEAEEGDGMKKCYMVRWVTQGHRELSRRFYRTKCAARQAAEDRALKNSVSSNPVHAFSRVEFSTCVSVWTAAV